MYKIILTFNNLEINNLQITDILNNIPIKDKANGSIVCMKNDDPWIDYINVSYDEIIKTIKYINDLKNKNITLEIKYKPFVNYSNTDLYNI